MICQYRHCHSEFEPKRYDQKFCTDKHRVAEWMLQNPRMKQDALPLSGSSLRDAGIKQAADHADAEIPDWQLQARRMVDRFLMQQGDVPFQAEYLRTWAHERGLPKPPSLRAWGAVIIWAKKRQLIEFVRHESVSNPKAHRAFASVWKAA